MINFRWNENMFRGAVTWL